MQKLCSLLCGVFLVALMNICWAQTAPKAATPIWVTAYYAGWQQDRLKPENIDFSAITHLVHFSVIPQVDGSLNSKSFDISPTRSAAIINAAHAAGRKVLLCVGGGGSSPAFRSAISDENRAAFIKNLVGFVTERGYDGLDIDMEPLEVSDSVPFQVFIRELRAAMRARRADLLLSAAVGDEPQIFAPIQAEFDQINLMTYDQSGTWPGWVTWHNASLFTSGLKFKGRDRLFPSAQLWVQKWRDAGFKPAQLGIGIAFYGLAWRGATGPNQSIEGVKTQQISYAKLMSQYFTPERYRWDEAGQAPYLSIDEPDKANDLFISYDDERLIKMKIDYVRAQDLGGVIIWELGSGYRADAPEGERDPLLQTVKNAAWPQKPQP